MNISTEILLQYILREPFKVEKTLQVLIPPLGMSLFTTYFFKASDIILSNFEKKKMFFLEKVKILKDKLLKA